VATGRAPERSFTRRSVTLRAVAAALTLLLFVPPVHASPEQRWRIDKDRWSEADENGFGKFVQSIGDSSCSSTESCIRSAANPYRDSDPPGMDIDADCAKFVYFLRAYYGWKNNLPFSFVNGVAGSGADLRFSAKGNRAVSRFAFIDRGSGFDGPAAMHTVLSSVSSATYRQPADRQDQVLPDFYSPRIAGQTIRAGAVLYDVNGHAAIVYRVDPDGRIHYLGASPDFSIARDVYGAQFGQPPARLGGGFKVWRPLVLVGAHKDAQGHLIGGHVVLARNEDIPDFSLVQYQGTDGTADDRSKAKFAYGGVDLGYFEYVRAAVSGGNMSYSPIYEFKTVLRSLCKEFAARAQSIDQAISDGIEKRPHPDRLPSNIYAAADTIWENYATPMRDARIKAVFAQSHDDLSGILRLWTERNPRIVYDGFDLKGDLEKVYAEGTADCSVTYLNSEKHPVTLSFEDLVHRLYTMSFDPYDCIERRWGDEAASCPDSDIKKRWYEAEEGLRGRIDPDATLQMGYSAAALEKLDRKRPSDPAELDIKSLVDRMGPQVQFLGMDSVGR
jgi:hypothetical protein